MPHKSQREAIASQACFLPSSLCTNGVRIYDVRRRYRGTLSSDPPGTLHIAHFLPVTAYATA